VEGTVQEGKEGEGEGEMHTAPGEAVAWEAMAWEWAETRSRVERVL
jgi:hypothetical protein